MISGILLAAGRSIRFGRPKQLLEIDGEPLVRRVVRQALASSLAGLRVVVGEAAADIRVALRDLDVTVVDNPRFAEGQSTSVRAGLRDLDPDVRGAMFLPSDQPFLTTELIDSLIDAQRRTGARIVVPVHGGSRGSPVLFDRSLFFELEKLTGDVGGRRVMPGYPDDIVEVPVADSRVLMDIDTPDDLRLVREIRALLER